MTASPAERYRSFIRRQRHDATLSGRFAKSFPFDLDDFQINANDALESGSNVLVAAPTGAGKTIIADFAVYLARHRGVKAFYTTPIKALSNQKYHDLVDTYGQESVGLLTGDTAVNPDAGIVVMTTEVLRNMLYERSSSLDSLGYVILDEVHYLADRFRGPVWEEVIIHLPSAVRIVALSATVSNVEDFSGWISSVRGDTALIVSEHRPVPLEQHVLIQQDDAHEPELIDLYKRTTQGEQTHELNPWLPRRLERLDRQAAERRPWRRSDRSRHGAHGGGRDTVHRHTPRRWAVVDELDFLDLLPGIYFIFSRTGCDKAVEQCLSAGLKLTTDDESERIRRIVDDMVDGQLSHEDLGALGFPRFRFAVEAGFAPHHAGMIALFRQIVERLFEMGLVRMVFATETLALGVNMPARCVVIERLEKYDGTGHVALTPGEFTQLTGRAGRRGVDSIGHAVVVDHERFLPSTMAALSSTRVYPLHSSFRPTFNMAVNLLNYSDYSTARSTLDHCFAQWEANRSAEALEARINRLGDAIASYERAFACSRGDFRDYMEIRRDLSTAQKDDRRALKRRAFRTDAERSEAFRRLDERIATLKRREHDHPCRSCPDLDRHLVWGHRWIRESRELDRATEAYDNRTGSVAHEFDSICDVLESLGYVHRSIRGARASLRLTPKGDMLRRLYSERDLLLAELMTRGVFDRLGYRELAAVVSSLIYEPRRGGDGEPRRFPGGDDGPVSRTSKGIMDVWGEVDSLCVDHGLDKSLPVDFSICDIVYDWTGGAPLSTVLEHSDITGGDFVRSMKRLSDLLGQMLEACGSGSGLIPTMDPAIIRQARDRVNRGVVAYSGVD